MGGQPARRPDPVAGTAPPTAADRIAALRARVLAKERRANSQQAAQAASDSHAQPSDDPWSHRAEPAQDEEDVFGHGAGID